MDNIIRYFQLHHPKVNFVVFSNKKECKGISKAKNLNIETILISKTELIEGKVGDKLIDLKVDLIVLAGFLLKIPESFVRLFINKIINIHPSLLPKYGGKGMYGRYVHEAVIAKKEPESGITIHYVNEHYDEGGIISQHTVKLEKNETVESLQEKIHQLEMKYFPITIENLLQNEH